MRDRPAELPSWPALMDIHLAEGYTTLGEDAFKTLMLRHGVQPVDVGTASLRWRRADIDEVLAKLPARRPRSADVAQSMLDSPPGVVPTDPVLAGLERARKRANR